MNGLKRFLISRIETCQVIVAAGYVISVFAVCVVTMIYVSGDHPSTSLAFLLGLTAVIFLLVANAHITAVTDLVIGICNVNNLAACGKLRDEKHDGHIYVKKGHVYYRNDKVCRLPDITYTVYKKSTMFEILGMLPEEDMSKIGARKILEA